MHSEVNIWSLVKNLLHKYNCVIVPGLGGFLAHQQSAAIDPVSLTINPPYKHVTFNAQLTLNDGLLVTKVADYLKINYIDAIKIVEIEVSNFHQSIKNNSQFTINGLGNFILNTSDKLIFTPEKNANFLIQSFGLETVKLSQLNAHKFTKIIPQNEILNSEKQFSTSHTSTENIDLQTENNTLVKSKQSRKRRGNGLAFTAIGTFLILILGINAYIFLQEGNLTPIRNKFDELNLGLKIKSLFDTDKKQETIVIEKSTKKLNLTELLAIYNPDNNKIEPNFSVDLLPVDPLLKQVNISYYQFEEENTSELATNTVLPESLIPDFSEENNKNTTNYSSNLAEPNTYYIIAGAFKSENRAIKLVEELNNDGFKKAAVILNPQAKSKHLKYYVTYSNYHDLNVTMKELSTINENENPDAWIFENK